MAGRVRASDEEADYREGRRDGRRGATVSELGSEENYSTVLVVIRRAHSSTVGCMVPAYPPPNRTGRGQHELGRQP
jgi:hypothetical protein